MNITYQKPRSFILSEWVNARISHTFQEQVQHKLESTKERHLRITVFNNKVRTVTWLLKKTIKINA